MVEQEEEETKAGQQQQQPQANLDIDKANLHVKIFKSSTDATKLVERPNQNAEGTIEQASEKFSQYSPVKITDAEEIESINNNQKRLRNNSNVDGQLL